ncbi:MULTISPECIES: hypothetical protein [unclassified Streptomyces]|uniref:hypothetical protein n=1 Tax=unclassified Streptomyces TaxID=2593676 RepID=UPI002DD9316C|nr:MULTISPECIES: hypothetical protein [unclassified Streptomyces]WSA93663.1 hypothetical protein OIE63_20290 [Streptomyces sp. NBC_01795]WSB78035.1 hypothetical protein OHB04_21130 [Streptomyces sp. NBC_01775]WSS13713.1 hypothetical protein OG533_18850 [Streptomyces sp. NBC_01186]WSS42535.1 hypothetical protein OG220_19600 [Streptomyces sp. NBC_01187]
MRKFQRTAVAVASILAFSGLAAGAAQAADLPFAEMQGDAATDCFTKETQREMDEGAGHHVTIVHCERDPQSPGTMLVFYRD